MAPRFPAPTVSSAPCDTSRAAAGRRGAASAVVILLGALLPRKLRLAPVVFLIGLGLPAAAHGADASAPLPDGLYAQFTTPRGVIVSELFFEQVPLTVGSFVGLAEGRLGPEPRKPFFDGLTFHRVVPEFVVQGGDPLGTGEGGPGYEFPDEFKPGLSHDAAGILSMANAGPDTNGSQFFFTLNPVRRLDFLHSVFGRVVQGLDVLPKIQQGETFEVKILRVGARAEAFQVDDARFARWIAAIPKGRHPNFEDPEHLLQASPPRARAINQKLGNIARFTGLDCYVRLHRQREAADTHAAPGTIAERFARKFGAEKDGIVAIYFAGSDEWDLWVGENRRAQFNPRKLTQPEAEKAFLEEARARTAVAIAAALRQGPPERPLPEEQKIRIQIDEVISGFIALAGTSP